jgi:hypothetical protein
MFGFNYHKYKLQGPAIGALGSVLGGLAAKAIMGDPAPIGPDTGVPGISKAVIQKKTKANDELSVAQVDPSNAIKYFSQAAEAYNNQSLQGISLYQNAFQSAIDNVNNTVKQSNQQLGQIVAQGTPASQEYMRMLGLNPPTANQTSDLYSRISGAGYNDLVQQMQNAESIFDPSERAQAKQQIMDQIPILQGQIAKNNSFTTPAPVIYKPVTDVTPEEYQTALREHPDQFNLYGQDALSQRIKAATNSVEFQNFKQNQYNDLLKSKAYGGATKQFAESGTDYITPFLASEQQKAQSSQAAYDQWLASKNANASSVSSQQQDVQGFINEFGKNYTPEMDKGYTGEQINNKLQNTPGYQFQALQGQQAINRAAAAAGGLNSGGTGAALSQFNQNLASSYYQNFLNNLGPLMSAGNTALSQIANNYMAQGGSLAQLYGNLGSGLLSAYQNIGQAQYNSYTNAGQVTQQSNIFNANAQNQAIAQKHAQDAKQQQDAAQNNIQAGYLNLANNQFGYQIAQNQNYGAGFAYNNSGGMLSGNGWPSYNPNTQAWYTI